MLTERVPNIGKEEVDINNVTSGNISNFSNLEKNASNDNLEVPDYKGDVKNLVSKIDDVNTLVQKGLMKTEVADEEVAELESQIHSLESSKLKDENNKRIEELKKELEDINRGVQTHDRHFKDSDKKVEELESEIRNLEGAEKFNINEENKSVSTENEGSENKEPKVTVGKGEFEIVDSERAEHIRLRQEMENAQQELNEAITNDISPRTLAAKFFGIDRQNLRQELKEKEDHLIVAKGNYIRNDRKSRDYRKIADRLNREKNLDEIEKLWTAESLNQKYHFLNTVDKRLEAQTSKNPEWFEKIKSNLVEKIKNNKKVTYTVGGLALLALAPASLIAGVGMAAGIGTSVGLRYFGGKRIEETREQRKKEIAYDSFKEGEDISDSEVRKTMSTLLSVEDEAQRKSTALKYGSRVAGVFAGGSTAYGLHDYLVENEISTGGFTRVYQVAKSYFEDFVPTSLESAPETLTDITSHNSVPDNLPIGDIEVVSENIVPFKPTADLMNYDEVTVDSNEAPVPETKNDILSATESLVETGFTHEVKPGENLSTILFDSIKEKVASGEITLPPNVREEDLSHYMYQSFPEMTSASDISPRLTAEEWISLGVESGNPHLIKPGENIDLQVLLEKMWGSSLDTNPIESIDIEVPSDSPNVTLDTGQVPENISAEPVESAPAPEEVSDKSQPVNAETIFAPKSLSVEDLQVAEAAMVNSEPSFSAETTPAPEGTSESIPQVESDEEILLEDFYKISPAYEEITHQFAWRESMHEYLASVIQVGVDKGEIALPLKVAFGENDFSDNIMGLVEERLPEVSRSLGNWDPDALTPEQWKEFGISSGDPKDISSDDVFKPGKLFEYIVSGEKDVLLNKSE